MTPKKMIIRFHELDEIEKITDKQKEQIINLYLKDESLRIITERFDCSIATILKVLKENKVKIQDSRLV